MKIPKKWQIPLRKKTIYNECSVSRCIYSGLTDFIFLYKFTVRVVHTGLCPEPQLDGEEVNDHNQDQEVNWNKNKLEIRELKDLIKLKGDKQERIH